MDAPEVKPAEKKPVVYEIINPSDTYTLVNYEACNATGVEPGMEVPAALAKRFSTRGTTT
jgi:hypothetical protein